MVVTLELTNAYLGARSSNRIFRDVASGKLYVFLDGYWPYGGEPTGAANSGVQVDIIQITGPNSDGICTITMWNDVTILYSFEQVIPLMRDKYRIARIGWASGHWITDDGNGNVVDEASAPTDIGSAEVLASDWYVLYPFPIP